MTIGSPISRLVLAAGLLASRPAPEAFARQAGPRIEVTVARSAYPEPLTGRLVVLVAKARDPEPRLAVSPSGPAMAAIDLESQPPGRPVVVDGKALGYPTSLDSLPAGDYFVQAVINVYRQVHRSDGHTIWVHLNDGTIEFFTAAAGNLYSEPQPIHLGDGRPVRIVVDRVIPKAPRPADTDWLRHVSIQSEKLTRFWGEPVFIHATVLLPRGYADHPEVRYPSLYTLGHGTPFQFTTDSTGVRNRGTINPVTGTETGFDFSRSWTSDGFPRLIAISLEQQTPYFPDSYSVNSANNGPYGDAIVEEVMPELERRFRIIRSPYARQLEGASTSGWQTLAMQLQHPDFFGGAWIFQPDPIDFRRYQLTNIYEDANAFTMPLGPFGSYERPFRRTTEGQVVWTTRQLSRFEAVLGTRGRSGFQLEAWEAVYGPTDADGYPRPLWNKLTGVIDHEVAEYMRDHGFDLLAYARKNWAALGPKLVGKLHFFAGDMDDFYLNLAVYQWQDFLQQTTNPHYEAEFTYGRPKKGHSWHPQTWADLVRRVASAVRAGQPAGERAEWLH